MRSAVSPRARVPRSGAMGCQRWLLTVFLVLSGFGCGTRAPRSEVAEAAPIKVATTTAVAAESGTFVEVSGVLDPHRRVALASKLPARVQAVVAEEGQRVQGNAILVRLDARDLNARRAQLVASRASAAAHASWSERELERTRTLAKGGALAGVQLDEIARVHDVAQASLKGVNAQLLELDANLADATIRAPFPGVVVRRLVEIGQFAAPAQPLLVVEDDTTLRVSVPVSEAEAASVSQGHRLALRSENDLRAEGTVQAVVSSGDAGTPGLRLIVTLDNTNHAWRAGAIAHVRLPSRGATSASVSVPNGAVHYRGALPGVWIVRDGRLVFAWVRLARSSGTTTEIASGVVAGEAVVIVGNDPSLRDGRRVVVGS